MLTLWWPILNKVMIRLRLLRLFYHVTTHNLYDDDNNYWEIINSLCTPYVTHTQPIGQLAYSLTHWFFCGCVWCVYIQYIITRSSYVTAYAMINYILTRIKEALEVLSFLTLNWVSVFEFHGYSVQHSVRSAMCALKSNKSHIYK